jgi:hypothetical protein
LVAPHHSWAGPLPGESELFGRPPVYDTFFGQTVQNVLSTANASARDGQGNPTAWQGTFAADDFALSSTSLFLPADPGPVVHVSWFGNYVDGYHGLTNQGVQNFMISFESDVFDSHLGIHRPGQPLVSQIVSKVATGLFTPLLRDSGTFGEAKYEPFGPSNPLFYYPETYVYDAELKLGDDFLPQKNTRYWLKIVALVDFTIDGAIKWGWRNRDFDQVSTDDILDGYPGFYFAQPFYHFGSAATAGDVAIVTGTSSTDLSVQQSGYVPLGIYPNLQDFYAEDLGFTLYSRPVRVPEPSSAILISVGTIALFVSSWRFKPSRLCRPGPEAAD